MTRSQRTVLLVRLAICMPLMGVVACGSGGGSSPNVSRGSGPDPGWAGQVLEGEQGPDQSAQIAVDGDQVVVVTVSDDGVLTGFASDDQGRFRPGEPTATGHRYLRLGGVTRFSDGWMALGSGGPPDDEELVFDVRAFSSPDGLAWSEVDAVGFEGQADVTGVTTVDDGLVGVGALRTADDPSEGGFGPVAWHSADGEGWTTMALPTGGGIEGSVQGVAATEGEVLAVGGVEGRGVMWSSTDGGGSWAIVERAGMPGTSSLSDIVAQGEVLVASGMRRARDESDGEASQILLHSADGGRSWREASDPPPGNRGEELAFPLFAGGERFFALGYSFIEAGSDPEICYADIELCRQDTAVALYVSHDGDRWRRVDTSGIGDGEAGEVDSITATDDGRIVAFSRVGAGIGAWTWPAGTPLPSEDEPVDPSTDVEVLGENDVPEPGRRYGVPLYIHCGMDWLYVGGEVWQRTAGGPDIEIGAGDEVPDHWPVAQQTIFGFATLVSEDLIEYSIGDGELIATYAPAREPPPGCE